MIYGLFDEDTIIPQGPKGRDPSAIEYCDLNSKMLQGEYSLYEHVRTRLTYSKSPDRSNSFGLCIRPFN
jgi:hypothetical protein